MRIIINQEQLSTCDNPIFMLRYILENEGFDLEQPYKRKDDFFNARVIFEQDKR